MKMSNSFTRAWYDWQRISLPVSNFRQGRVSSPTYEIEHDLDHLASYVHTLGEKTIHRDEIEYARLVTQEISELENIEGKLARCGLTEEKKMPFSKFISATRALLTEISKQADSS